MNKNIKNIIKEKIKITNLLKTELLLKIKKSILQNNNINNSIKLFTKLQNSNKTHISKKHKICISTGKRGGLLNGFSFSRYKVKTLILENKLTNIKKNNW